MHTKEACIQAKNLDAGFYCPIKCKQNSKSVCKCSFMSDSAFWPFLALMASLVGLAGVLIINAIIS